MADKGRSNVGIQFNMKVGGNMTLIAEVQDFESPGFKNPSLNISSADHTTVQRASSRMVDVGPVSLTCLWLASNASFSRLLTSLKNGTLEDFEVIFPDPGGTAVSSSLTWSGFVTDVTPPKGRIPDQMTFSVKIDVHGDATFTAAA